MAKYFENKIVWITGASSGIGEATAYEFAKQGATVILSARRKDKLDTVAEKCKATGATTAILPLDLENTANLETKAKEAESLFGRIDVLFNNGGISQRSLTWETPIDIDRKIMEIDYFSGVVLTKAVLKGMIRRKTGWIIANSSISGAFGFPLRSAYSAAKHAVYGFYESLRAELRVNNIPVHITIVAPGRINTPISMSAIGKEGKATGIMDPGQANGFPAEKCAKAIVKATAKGKPELLVGGSEIISVYLRRIFPRIFFKIVSKIAPQ